jgi:hypothetical protein
MYVRVEISHANQYPRLAVRLRCVPLFIRWRVRSISACTGGARAVGVEERWGVRVASSEDGRGTIFSAWQIASRWLRSAFLFFLHGRYAHGTHSLGASLSEQISACWLEWSVIHLPIIGQTDRSVCDLIDIPTFLANGQCEVSTYVSPTNLSLWFMKAISNETCRNLSGKFVVVVYESNQQWNLWKSLGSSIKKIKTLGSSNKPSHLISLLIVAGQMLPRCASFGTTLHLPPTCCSCTKAKILWFIKNWFMKIIFINWFI